MDSLGTVTLPAAATAGLNPGEVRTVCPYCGVGCGIIASATGGRVSAVRGDPLHPANFGRLCSKGSTLHLSTAAPARLRAPMGRHSRSAALTEMGWADALEMAAQRFAQTIQAHGPDSVAFYLSGQLLTEDYYVFNKLVRALAGTNNIDTNSRLCMSSAVSGYKLALGADAPPACYEDIDLAGCLFIAGSNAAWAHPVLFRRVEDARRRNPALKIVVVDPRRTDTTALADLHLALLPGTDVALFHGMLHVLLRDGLCDQTFIDAHTNGWEALRGLVAEYSPDVAARLCGVNAADIVTAARWFAGAGPTLSLYCQGLNQWATGTDKNTALINLHLATGQIGRPGAGPLSLTGQPNAMGGREVGGMATLLPGHRDLANPEHRAEMARFWGVQAISARPGKSAVELFDALHDGSIKAVWIACTNPAHSLPDQSRAEEALRRASFVVVQEAFSGTDTSAFADLLLPAATWGEKEGTVTNSERRVSRVRALVPPPGEARPDWVIAEDFARRLACHLKRPQEAAGFAHATAAEVYREYRETTRGRDLDISALDHERLDRQGPQQWPVDQGTGHGTLRLYTDRRFATADGRARFTAPPYRAAAESTDAQFPLHLNTGRLRDQWHGMSRTGLVPQLFNHAAEPKLSMHPDDLTRRGLAEGNLARVRSRRGELILRVAQSEDLRPSQVFLAMHWSSRFLSGGGSNRLTRGDLDPISRQPELKHCAVEVEKLDYPWELIALRAGDAERHLAAARGLLGRFAYASCGLYGQSHPLAVFRAAGPGPAAPELLAALDLAFELVPDATALRYEDSRRDVSKLLMLAGQVVVGARLSGETAAQGWIQELMAEGAPLDALRPSALAPVARPPAAGLRGRILCSCTNVAEAAIQACLAAGLDVPGLQRELGCGITCGSCVPELTRLYQAHLARSPA